MTRPDLPRRPGVAYALPHRPFDMRHPDPKELHALMLDEIGVTTSSDGGW